MIRLYFILTICALISILFLIPSSSIHIILKLITECAFKLLIPSGVAILQRLSNFSILNPLSFNFSAKSGLIKLPPRAPESRKAWSLLSSFRSRPALSLGPFFPFALPARGRG